MAKERSKAELIAYASFLFDEQRRHESDIRVIEQKLKILSARGINPMKPGDWISEEELMKCKIVEDECNV